VLRHPGRRQQELVALRGVERLRLEARQAHCQRIQIHTDRLAPEPPSLHQHGAGAAEGVGNGAALRGECADEVRRRDRMQAGGIAVKAVHVIAHAVLRIDGERALHRLDQLLRALETLDAPAHVRKRAPRAARGRLLERRVSSLRRGPALQATGPFPHLLRRPLVELVHRFGLGTGPGLRRRERLSQARARPGGPLLPALRRPTIALRWTLIALRRAGFACEWAPASCLRALGSGLGRTRLGSRGARLGGAPAAILRRLLGRLRRA
jgi:hypothetical protein